MHRQPAPSAAKIYHGMREMQREQNQMGVVGVQQCRQVMEIEMQVEVEVVMRVSMTSKAALVPTAKVRRLAAVQRA